MMTAAWICSLWRRWRTSRTRLSATQPSLARCERARNRGHSNDKGRPMATKGKTVLGRMMKEVFDNEPSTVARADVSDARKRKMKIAIAYSKARKAGAKV